MVEWTTASPNTSPQLQLNTFHKLTIHAPLKRYRAGVRTKCWVAGSQERITIPYHFRNEREATLLTTEGVYVTLFSRVVPEFMFAHSVKLNRPR